MRLETENALRDALAASEREREELSAIIQSKDGWKELWNIVQLQGQRALEAEREREELAAKLEAVEATHEDEVAAHQDTLRLLADANAKIAVMAESVKEVIRISDRDHVAWNRAKAILANLPDRTKLPLDVVAAAPELVSLLTWLNADAPVIAAALRMHMGSEYARKFADMEFASRKPIAKLSAALEGAQATPEVKP